MKRREGGKKEREKIVFETCVASLVILDLLVACLVASQFAE